MHTELERCEPRVVSLLEAADWLRQANEKTGATTHSASSSDQTIVDSHARLSHLRARLTVLINMTASYTTKLGTTLGYDMTPDSVCIRLHQVRCAAIRPQPNIILFAYYNNYCNKNIIVPMRTYRGGTMRFRR